jgi:branched-chain amino acid transport system substrate-binding protein
MRGSRRSAVVAALLGISLVAAACGSSNDSGTKTTDAAGSTPTTAPGPTTSVSLAIKTGEFSGEAITDGKKLPADMTAWESLWAAQRAAIVKRIKDNKWGVSADGKTLSGPEGFTVDLSKCPSGWSATEGLTDTEIKIGQTLAQSGTLAYAANYGKGQEAIMSYYSDKGAFKDSTGKTRKTKYLQKDDGYDAAKTVPLVDEFLDSEKVFGLVTLGSPNILKTYDKVNQRCVPQMFNQSGHPAWGDPVNHPWTTGLGLAYTTEAVLWGSFIEDHISEFPDGVTVAALVESNEFGKAYDVGFKAWLASSKIKDKVKYETENVDPQSPTITNQMTTLGSKKPQFFIAMVAGTFCAQAVIEAGQNGMKEAVKYLWQPNTCAGSTQLSKEKVGGDGKASEGWWIVNGGSKDVRDPEQQKDPIVIWAREIIKAHGDDPDSAAELGLGMIYGWAWAQVLQIAGELDGGLNRANLILAARALDMNNPLQLPGMVFHADGNKDSYYTEGGVFQQFDVAKQSYISKTELFNLDGASKNCNFQPAVGSCELY